VDVLEVKGRNWAVRAACEGGASRAVGPRDDDAASEGRRNAGGRMAGVCGCCAGMSRARASRYDTREERRCRRGSTCSRCSRAVQVSRLARAPTTTTTMLRSALARDSKGTEASSLRALALRPTARPARRASAHELAVALALLDRLAEVAREDPVEHLEEELEAHLGDGAVEAALRTEKREGQRAPKEDEGGRGSRERRTLDISSLCRRRSAPRQHSTVDCTAIEGERERLRATDAPDEGVVGLELEERELERRLDRLGREALADQAAALDRLRAERERGGGTGWVVSGCSSSSSRGAGGEEVDAQRGRPGCQR